MGADRWSEPKEGEIMVDPGTCAAWTVDLRTQGAKVKKNQLSYCICIPLKDVIVYKRFSITYFLLMFRFTACHI
jgi:hypothetical protein